MPTRTVDRSHRRIPSSSTPTVLTARRSQWTLTAALFLLAVLPYAGTLGYHPLNWDDPEYVGLPWYRDAGAFLRIWTSFDTPQVYPVVFTSFWIDSAIWGDRLAAIRLTNLLLHGIAAVLAFLLARHLLARIGDAGPGPILRNRDLWREPATLTRDAGRDPVSLTAFLVALAFALHPIQVGSVAWLAERKNMLVAGFSFGSILLYLRSRPERFDRKWAGSLVLAILAMLSKSTAVVLPLLILILGYRHTLRRRNLLRIAPFFLVAALQSALTVFREHGPAVVSDESWIERIAIAGGAIWFHLSKLLLPIGLSPLYPRWDASAAVVPGLLGLSALGIIAWVLFRFRARIPWLVNAGLLVFVVSQLPTLGFIPFGYLEKSFVADHFLYVPSFGLWIAIAGIVWAPPDASRRSRLRPRTVFVLAVLLLLVCAVMSARRARHWESSESYWTHVLETNPNSWVAWGNRGEARLQEGRFQAARADIEGALSIRPDYPEASFNLGLVLERQSDPAGAINAYRRALDVSPDHPDAHWNLGRLLLLSGSVQEGLGHLEAAHALDPALPLEQTLRAFEAQRHGDPSSPGSSSPELAALLQEIERAVGAQEWGQAIDKYAEASALDPTNPALPYNLGNLLRRLGRTDEAVRSYERALERDPDFADAWINLGATLAESDQPDRAEQALRRAIELRPTDADAHQVYGRVWFARGDLERAHAELEQAVRLAPARSGARYDLAIVTLRQGKTEEARTLLETVLAMEPGHASARQALEALPPP